ncbi:MAG: glycosyltransferase family 2 protein [Polyangiaceae bacterium]|nr:glycosyltransferase family 2 protein [Polyangiaceae bacterium]
MSFRPCLVIPTYNNPATIGAVVKAAREHLQDILVVDDGSDAAGRDAVAELGATGLAVVHHRPQNGGKGAAVKTGIRLARELGFSHVLQIDGDGQHTLGDIPRFLEQARLNPDALILGQPRFDSSAPRARLWGRKLTHLWVHIETGGKVIAEPMCGYRVYPVAAALAVMPASNRMDFDPEIAVRMVWHGVKVVNLETDVRYLTAEEGGVSHFQMGWDNVRITWMHIRLVVGAILLLITGHTLRGKTWRTRIG